MATFLAKVSTVADIYYFPFLIAHVLLYFGLVHTTAYSRWRYLIVVAIVACCSIAVRSEVSLSIPGSAGGQYIWGMMMSSSHWLLLAHATYPANGKGPAWKWGLDMLRSARWGVSQKILPKFSCIPSKNQLIMDRAWDLSWTLTFLYFVRAYPLLIHDFDFVLVEEGFLHRLTDVTAREWLIRIYLAVRGKLEPYLMLKAGHSFFTIIGLFLGDNPKDWPPLFGNIAGAYRVRSFYVYFWHHLVRKIFTSHAAFITNSILRIPEGSSVSRYVILALSFTISAIMHIFVDPETPLKCSVWPQFRYYLSIAGAIILEDLVVAGYRSLRKRKPTQKKPMTTSITEGKSTSVLADSSVRERVRSTNYSENTQEEGPGKAETGTKTVAAAKIDDDTFMKIMPWFGYLWVLSFEVWSCSKLLYFQKQCTIPPQLDWDWLVKQIRSGSIE